MDSEAPIPKLGKEELHRQMAQLSRHGLGPAGAYRLTHYRDETWGWLVAPEFGEALDLARGNGPAAAMLRRLLRLAGSVANLELSDLATDAANGHGGQLLARLAAEAMEGES